MVGVEFVFIFDQQNALYRQHKPVCTVCFCCGFVLTFAGQDQPFALIESLPGMLRQIGWVLCSASPNDERELVAIEKNDTLITLPLDLKAFCFTELEYSAWATAVSAPWTKDSEILLVCLCAVLSSF